MHHDRLQLRRLSDPEKLANTAIFDRAARITNDPALNATLASPSVTNDRANQVVAVLSSFQDSPLHDNYFKARKSSSNGVGEACYRCARIKEAPTEFPDERKDRATRLHDALTFLNKVAGEADGASESKSWERPYPSGGAIYPTRLFLIVPDDTDPSGDSKVFLYRPKFAAIDELFGTSGQKVLNAIEKVAGPGWLNKCDWIVFYVVDLELALGKYGYRGYRFALVDSGAAIQQAEIAAAQSALQGALYGGFNDDEVCSGLGLDPERTIPIAAHAFFERSTDG